MNAKKCDRCERFYEPYQNDATHYFSNMIILAEDTSGPFSLTTYCERRQFELCPDCMKDAVNFMQEKLPRV